MLKLAWKFGESKWYPYWVIVLTSSSGTNYVPNDNEGDDQYWLICITTRFNAISKPSWKFREPKWNPYWVIGLTNSSGTNYVPNEHEVLTNMAHL